MSIIREAWEETLKLNKPLVNLRAANIQESVKTNQVINESAEADELSKAFSNFVTAAVNLDKAWDKYKRNNPEGAALINGYPFDQSFDELLVDILAWEEENLMVEDLNEARFDYSKEQEFTSKSTAHGNGVANKGQGRVPALFKNIKEWRKGTVNFDYGCGEATTQAQIANFLADKGVDYIGFDKYNQSVEEQNASLDKLDEIGGYTDTATCANVLNVVKEKDIRVNEIIANIYGVLKNGGTAYFDVYIGSGAGAGSGQGRATGGDKYQTFMKLEDYAEEIGEVFGQDNVKVVGNRYIKATK